MNSSDQKILRAMIGDCKDESIGFSFGFGKVESSGYSGHTTTIEVDGHSHRGYVIAGNIKGVKLCASIWNKKLMVVYKRQEYFQIKDVPDEKVRNKLHEWLDVWL